MVLITNKFQKHHDLVRMLLMDQDGFLTENNKLIISLMEMIYMIKF
ncbi:cardiolipin synthetase [Staphylococcus aureus]|nr:cardiolipin synthetase [Staphylococcus aureus]